MERMSRPLLSASRYELIASGPAFVSACTGAERSLGGKYRIDRKLVVVLLRSAKDASVACSPASATAMALLVVPKSNPITGGMSLPKNRVFCATSFARNSLQRCFRFRPLKGHIHDQKGTGRICVYVGCSGGAGPVARSHA